MWVKLLSTEAQAAIAATCESFIAEKLKPGFLPEIRTTEFNYPIDIRGRWRGSKLRYRSGFPHNAGEEFDAPFARLDHIAELHSETRFDVMWHRHTGQRVLIHPAATLDEALELIETNPVLQPHT
ncbi:MAG: hypothetical protein NTV97_06695 [Alphaproteobacteria bacterium]|nr:hypothetical protein [Alphaproteobacteria bacterium]